MFKNRLKMTCKFIFENLIAPVLTLALIIFVMIRFPIVLKIGSWCIVIFLGISLIIGAIIFIHWLFIEPFKKDNKY